MHPVINLASVGMHDDLLLSYHHHFTFHLDCHVTWLHMQRLKWCNQPPSFYNNTSNSSSGLVKIHIKEDPFSGWCLGLNVVHYLSLSMLYESNQMIKRTNRQHNVVYNRIDVAHVLWNYIIQFPFIIILKSLILAMSFMILTSTQHANAFVKHIPFPFI